MNDDSVPNTILHGRRLFIVRSAWVALVLLILTLFVALIPLNFRNIIFDWQVTRSVPELVPSTHLRSYALYVLTLRYLAALVFFVIAAVIVWRRSNDWVALLVALTLVLLPLSFNLGGYTENWGLYPSPWNAIFLRLDGFFRFFALFCFLALFYLFPDGRCAPRPLRYVAVSTGVVLMFGAFGSLLFTGDWDGESAWTIFVLLLLTSMAAAMFGQIYRYRRISTPIQRQQTRLVVWGLAAVPVTFAASLVLSSVEAGSREAALYALLNIHLQVFMLTLIPLTIGFSILRYQLWDIDIIINRTLVYGALTVIIITLYVLVVGTLGALFQAGGNLLLAILATGLIAILFQPLRQRLQRGVNRLMYGQRDDPYAVLSHLGQRLESAIAPEAALHTIVETVAQALKLPYAAIVLNDEDEAPRVKDEVALEAVQPSSIVAAWGVPPNSPEGEYERIPLIYQAATVGWLFLAPRAPGENFSPADRRLLEDIARHAGAAVHAVRLTADLRHSRERIVTAREEERRRLRRDLHDGLGPTLASQTLKLDAAIDLVESDPAATRAMLLELKSQTQATVADIRRLVYELRPPALDELGLVAALREHVTRYTGSSNGLRVSIEAPERLPALSAAVEVAAYRIALEAVTNVVRHAHADSCYVRFAIDDALLVEIVDNGSGIQPNAPTGVGLTSMRERAEELGGTCAIDSPPGGGTRVVARLPMATSDGERA